MLAAGTKLGPRALMLAAAMNHAELPVRRRPKVAILATGDEVVPPGSKLAPDQIVSSVPYGIAALVEAQGGEAMSLGIAKDDAREHRDARRAPAKPPTFSLTIGGASVGERDLVAAALKSEGLELDFWKIAMRPGKPMLYGRMGSNACWAAGESGLGADLRPRVPAADDGANARPGRGARPDPEAVLGEAIEANGAREHYMRAVSAWRETGERRGSPPALAGLLAGGGTGPGRLPDRANAARPGRLPEGARVRIMPARDAVKAPETRIAELVGSSGGPTASRGIPACGTQTEHIKCS